MYLKVGFGTVSWKEISTQVLFFVNDFFTIKIWIKGNVKKDSTVDLFQTLYVRIVIIDNDTNIDEGFHFLGSKIGI